MKKMPVIMMSLIVLCSAGLATGCGKKERNSALIPYAEGMDYVKSQEREKPQIHKVSYEFMGGEDVMPIGGFYGPYGSGGSMDGNDFPDYLTEEIFKELNECGVNCIVYTIDRWATGGTNSNLKKALDLGEKYGVGYYVDSYSVMSRVGTHTEDVDISDETWEWLPDVINEISDNGKRKSFLGIHDVDEPFTKQLDNLDSFRKAFYSIDIVKENGYHVCTDVLGSWEGKFDLNGTDENITYEEYMERFMGTEKPKFLSVTQYPFKKQNDDPHTYAQSLYGKLSLYRSYAKKYEVPLWRMMQAGGQHNDLAEWVDTKPVYQSEGEFLLDYNISLAYGAKGIQFFPLIQPLHYAYETGGKYDFENRNGLIGGDGNLTRWYYYAKRANEQVQAIDHILMNSESEKMLVHGDEAKNIVFNCTTTAIDTYDASEGYYELTKVKGDDCFIGCFNYKGHTALYVVNIDAHNKADVSLSFDNDKYLFEVIQRAVSSKGVGGNINLRLDAGEGALIVLQ